MTTATSISSQMAIQNLLTISLSQLNGLIQSQGDGVIASGRYTGEVTGNSCGIVMWNTNNHQLTYGVAQAALAALRNYMSQENNYGWLLFDIWDGDNQVGAGALARNPAGG